MTVGFLLGQRKDGRPTPVRVDDLGRVQLAPLAFDWRAVTPNDGDDLPGGVADALSCTTSGTAAVVTEAGSAVTVALAAGTTFPGRFTRVKASGTSALGIVAGYGPG